MWWYFEPAEVWKRNRPGGPPVAEFVGERLRGRKFYFHQDPLSCVEAYHPDSNNWAYTNHAFHPVRLHCMDRDQHTLPFRVYLDGIPRSLFLLLMNALRPGQRMRHKLGYAKAFGYGSIEFVLRSAQLRPAGLGIPRALKAYDIPLGNWSEALLVKGGFADLVDRNALNWLARILGWPHDDLLFMYPQYRAQEFKQPVSHDHFSQRAIQLGMPVSDTMVVTPREGRTVANALWGTKRTIDFRLFQGQAQGWDRISQRRP
jgi:hypothetical protein